MTSAVHIRSNHILDEDSRKRIYRKKSRTICFLYCLLYINSITLCATLLVMLCIKEWCLTQKLQTDKTSIRSFPFLSLDDGFEEIVMKKPPVICSEKGYEEPRKNMTKMFIFIVQTAKHVSQSGNHIYAIIK